MNNRVTEMPEQKELLPGKKVQPVTQYPLTIKFLMAYLIVSAGRIHELFPVLTLVPIGDLTGGGALVCFIYEASQKGLGKIVLQREEKYVIGILALGVITIPTAVWPGGSFGFITGTYFKLLVLFFLMTLAIRTIADLRKMVLALLISVFFIGMASVKNDVSHGMSVSISYDANDIALVMVCTLPFIIYSFKAAGLAGKVFTGVCFCLCIQTIITSVSRGGFLGLVAICGYLLFKAKKGMKLVMIIVIIAGAIMMTQLSSSSYMDRISTIWNPQSEQDKSGAGRIDIWKAGLKMFSNNIFLGVGIDGFTTAEGYTHFDAGGKWSTAHNSFIQIGVELGIVGFVLFLLLTFGTVIRMRKLQKIWQHKSEYKDILWLTYAIEAGMIGYIVCGFFLSKAYFEYLYFMLGISVAVQKIAMRIAANKERDTIAL